MARQADRKHNTTAAHVRSQLSGEPSIREMLDDPVVQTVMAVYHVTEKDVMAVMTEARERLLVARGGR